MLYDWPAHRNPCRSFWSSRPAGGWPGPFALRELRVQLLASSAGGGAGRDAAGSRSGGGECDEASLRRILTAAGRAAGGGRTNGGSTGPPGTGLNGRTR